MDAVTIGTSPAGVVWTNYPKASDTGSAFQRRTVTMRKRLRLLTERHENKARGYVRVRLTEAQMGLVLDEMDRTDVCSPHRIGRTYVDLTPSDAAFLAEGIESTRMDEGEIESMILGGANKDLTDAQVIFGTTQAMKCAAGAVKALRAA